MINELLAPNLCSFLVSTSPGDLGAERRGSGCSWWAGLPGQCQGECPVRFCSRARAHTPLPSPLSCTVSPGGRAVPEDAGRSSPQNKHMGYMSSDSEDPAVRASLSPNHVVAMATSLTKPELAEGISINPFLGPQLHLVHPATCPGFP